MNATFMSYTEMGSPEISEENPSFITKTKDDSYNNYLEVTERNPLQANEELIQINDKQFRLGTDSAIDEELETLAKIAKREKG